MATTTTADHSHDATVSGAAADRDGSPIRDEASSDQDSTVDLVKEKKPAGAKLNKREALKRHCGKFWWWYVIVVVVILIILLPIVFTVIIPAIVQAIVSHQGLPVHSGFIKTNSPSNLIMTLNTTINTPLGVTLDPLTLKLSNSAATSQWPFTNFTLGEMTVRGLTDAGIDKQSTPVTNTTQLTEWIAMLYDQRNISIYLDGRPSVHVGALHTNPTLTKTITIPALNKLEGKSIDNLNIQLEKDDEGNNLFGLLNLPNNGILGLDLGTLVLTLTSGTVKIGNVTLDNVILNPGPNPITFKGVLDFKALIQNFGTVLSSQAQPLNRGDIDLNATTISATTNGVHIPYLEDVLKTRTLTFSVNVVTLLADVIAGLLNSNKKSLGDLIQDIVGNKTLIDQVNSNWNSSEALNIGANNNKRKRLASREAMTWELLKLSMKMNRNRF